MALGHQERPDSHSQKNAVGFGRAWNANSREQTGENNAAIGQQCGVRDRGMCAKQQTCGPRKREKELVKSHHSIEVIDASQR